MTQTETLEIDIANEISPTLFIRKTAVDLFEKIEHAPESVIVVDFKNVDFLNRSFAHEYLKLKYSSEKKISEIHLSNDVELMISIVKNAHFKERDRYYQIVSGQKSN